MPPVAPFSPAQRPENHHQKHGGDDPGQGSKDPGHRRLPAADGEQRPFDTDPDYGQAKDAGQMGSICSLHQKL
jgi:hypothetical protein